MTNFSLILLPAGDRTLRGSLRGRFFDKLNQAGNAGLVEAVEKVQLRLGFFVYKR